MINTLYDLTGKHNGIVIHGNRKPIICNWTNINGIPRRFNRDDDPDDDNSIGGLGEPITDYIGHWHDNLEDWVRNLTFSRRKKPERGWVYVSSDGDITVIAPDEWE